MTPKSSPRHSATPPRRASDRLRALRLAHYRHRRLAWVPAHLYQDIIGDTRKR